MVVIVRVLVPLSFPPIAHKMWHPAHDDPSHTHRLSHSHPHPVHLNASSPRMHRLIMHRHKKTTSSNGEKIIEKQTNETAANTPTHAKQPSASYLNVLLFFLEHRSFLVVNDTCIQQLLCYCTSRNQTMSRYRLKSHF